MLDHSKIRSDIALLIADCIHLKSLLRTTWTRPMADEQRRLVRVRRKLTELFVLLAFSREKLHVLKAPPHFVGQWDAGAYHRTIAMRLTPDYADDRRHPAPEVRP